MSATHRDPRVHVRTRRLVSLTDRHLFALRYEVVAFDARLDLARLRTGHARAGRRSPTTRAEDAHWRDARRFSARAQGGALSYPDPRERPGPRRRRASRDRRPDAAVTSHRRRRLHRRAPARPVRSRSPSSSPTTGRTRRRSRAPRRAHARHARRTPATTRSSATSATPPRTSGTRGHRGRRAGRPPGHRPLQPLPAAAGDRPRGGPRRRGQGRHRPRLRGPLLLGHRGLRRPVPHAHAPAPRARRARVPRRHARRRPRARARAQPPRRAVSVAHDQRARRRRRATSPAPPSTTSTPTSPTPCASTARSPATTR